MVKPMVGSMSGGAVLQRARQRRGGHWAALIAALSVLALAAAAWLSRPDHRADDAAVLKAVRHTLRHEATIGLPPGLSGELHGADLLAPTPDAGAGPPQS